MDIELIIFDVDGTLIDCPGTLYSAWDMLGDVAGFGKEYAANVEKYWKEKYKYHQWIQEDLELIKGMEVEPIKKQLIPPPYAPGVKELFQVLRGKYITGLLTAGVDFVAEYIKKDLGLEFCIANEVGITDGKFDGTYKVNVELWVPPDKSDHIKEAMKTHLVPKEKPMFVGDHDNDLTAGKEAGVFVARKPKSQLIRDLADYVIEDDLTELLAILEK